MNDTSNKMTQATPDTFPGSGNDMPAMSPQKKAELYAKISLILGFLEWIPMLIARATKVNDESVIIGISLLALIGSAFLFPLNKELKWLEPEKRTKALVIGTVAFFANLLLIKQTMVLVILLAAIIHFFIRIPGHYFFLFDQKTDTVHIKAPDRLTQDYLGHEYEKHPTDPMHRMLRTTFVILGIALFFSTPSGISAIFTALAIMGIAGVILRVRIKNESEYRHSAIGQSVLRFANTLLVVGIITLIVLFVCALFGIPAFAGPDRDDD